MIAQLARVVRAILLNVQPPPAPAAPNPAPPPAPAPAVAPVQPAPAVVVPDAHAAVPPPPADAGGGGNGGGNEGGGGNGNGGDGGNPAVAAADKGVESLRALAKWLIGIFAAIAAILTAGIQLTSIGHLDGSGTRLKIAVVGLAVALLAVAGIIWFVVRVLTANSVTLIQLTREEDAHPGSGLMRFIRDAGFLEAGFPSIERIHERYRAKYDVADAVAVDDLVPVMLADANFYIVKRRFRQAVVATLIFAGLAAVAISAFAWAANPPSSDKPGPFQVPTEAFVTLSDNGKTALTDALGKGCVTVPVHVIVLSSTDSSADVVTVPTAACKLAKFTVGSGASQVTGYIAPVNTVPVPGSLATAAVTATPKPTP